MKIRPLPSSQFLKEYRLPVLATAVFILLVSAMLGLRTYDRMSLAKVLTSKGPNGSGYAALLSNDKTDEFTKTDQESKAKEDSATTSPPTNTTPFTVTPSPAPPAPAPGPNPPPPPPPFSASISEFVLESVTMDCPGGSIMPPGDCSKRYVFRATVHGLNGPGTVAYTWHSNVPPANTSGSFPVGSGETYTPTRNDFRIPCNQPMTFYIRIELTQPNNVYSNHLQQYHSC